MRLFEAETTRWDRENELRNLQARVAGCFVGGRRPTRSQMRRVEELRGRIAKLQSELRK